eukprot:g11217.t1
MHEFVGLANKDSLGSLRGPEAMRGQALSCSLFSCIAIGGLMAGCPPRTVALHMSSAQASLSKFGGLSDVYAVRAYVLYAMASEFLEGLDPGTEYRKGMEAARAVFDKLPAKEREPLLSAVLSHFMVLEGLPLLQHVETNTPPGGVGGGGGGHGFGVPAGRGGGDAAGSRVHDAAARERNSGTSYVCCKTADEEAIFQKALERRADVSLVMSPHPPPAYVVADATLLTIRFSRDRGDVTTRLWHLHDFATSELRRFRQEEKGAVAILALMNPLMGVKIRLRRLDGMLEAADLACSLLQTCPGLLRIYHVHVAHVSMAVYRLFGRRQAYDALRELFARTIGQETPSFDDIGPKARVCDLPVCAMHLEKLLRMEAPHLWGGSTGGSGGGTAGAWSSSITGGLPGNAAVGVGAGAGFGAAGGAVGAATWNEQDGTQAAMAMAARQSQQRVEGNFPGYSNPYPYPVLPRDQLLARGLHSAATAGATGAAPFPRPELPPSLPGWGYPVDMRLVPQVLPTPLAPQNPLAASPLKTSTPFDGLPQSQPLVAGPPTGFGTTLGSVLGSAPAAGGLFGASSLPGARREQAALMYSGERLQQPTSQGGGGGVVCPGGADMTRNASTAAWAGGNRRRDGGDGGVEGGARVGVDMQYHRDGGAQHHRGREYGDTFTSTVGLDAAAHHQKLRRSYGITPADSRGVDCGILGVDDESSPGDAPPPAADL